MTKIYQTISIYLTISISIYVTISNLSDNYKDLKHYFKEIKALKNLIENKNLVIQKADKGNIIVILNKNDYISRLY